MNRKRQLIGGSALSVGGTAVNQLIGLAVLAFLARHLDARDFGIVAIVVLVLDLTRDLMVAGLPDYLVRSPRWDERVAASSFWFQLAAGALLMALAIAVGLAMPYLGLSEIGQVLLALSPIYLFEASSSVALARLRHRVRFGEIALAGIAGSLASAAAAVWVVTEGGGYWALVIARLASSLVAAAAILAFAGWRPRTAPAWAALRPAVTFSVHLAGGRLFGVLNVKATDLIVGFVGGPALLGAYQLASRALHFVLQTCLGPLQTVALTALATEQDPARLRASALEVLRATALVVFPIAAGLSAIAPEFVAFVFGPDWLALSLPMSILTLACIPAVINYLLNPVMVKLDRTAIVLQFAVTLSAIGIGLTAVAAGWGLVAVSAAFLARTAIGSVIACVHLTRHAGITAPDILRAIVRPLAGVAAIWTAVALARAQLPAVTDLAQIAVLATAGAAAYLLLVAPMLTRSLRLLALASGKAGS